MAYYANKKKKKKNGSKKTKGRQKMKFVEDVSKRGTGKFKNQKHGIYKPAKPKKKSSPKPKKPKKKKGYWVSKYKKGGAVSAMKKAVKRKQRQGPGGGGASPWRKFKGIFKKKRR